jgi:hypothetical protein
MTHLETPTTGPRCFFGGFVMSAERKLLWWKAEVWWWFVSGKITKVEFAQRDYQINCALDCMYQIMAN